MNANENDLEKLNSLYCDIRTVLAEARSAAYRAVNFEMVRAYWQIGCLIVESEQKGQERAEYGKGVLKELSQRLVREFGKGYSVQSLRNMRQFYTTFSKRSALRSESPGSVQLLCLPGIFSGYRWTVAYGGGVSGSGGFCTASSD